MVLKYSLPPAQMRLCEARAIAAALNRRFGRLWCGEPNAVSNAIGYARFFNRSHNAVIRVYDEAGNVIDMHEHAGEFKEP